MKVDVGQTVFSRLEAVRQRRKIPFFVAASIVGVRVEVLKHIEKGALRKTGLKGETLIVVVEKYCTLLGVSPVPLVKEALSNADVEMAELSHKDPTLKKVKIEDVTRRPSIWLAIASLLLCALVSQATWRLEVKLSDVNQQQKGR